MIIPSIIFTAVDQSGYHQQQCMKNKTIINNSKNWCWCWYWYLFQFILDIYIRWIAEGSYFFVLIWIDWGFSLFHAFENSETYIIELLPAAIKTTPPATAETIIIVCAEELSWHDCLSSLTTLSLLHDKQLTPLVIC